MNNVFATSILFCQQKLWRGRAAEKWNCWRLEGKHQNTEMGGRRCCAFPVGHPREHRGAAGGCTLASLWAPVMLCSLHLLTPSLCPAWLLRTTERWLCHHRGVQWVMLWPAWFVTVSLTTMLLKPLIDIHFTNLKQYLFHLFCFLLLKLKI